MYPVVKKTRKVNSISRRKEAKDNSYLQRITNSNDESFVDSPDRDDRSTCRHSVHQVTSDPCIAAGSINRWLSHYS